MARGRIDGSTAGTTPRWPLSRRQSGTTAATAIAGHQRRGRRRYDNGGRVQRFQVVQAVAETRAAATAAAVVAVHRGVPGGRDGQVEHAGRVARQAQTVRPPQEEERTASRSRFGDRVTTTVAGGHR